MLLFLQMVEKFVRFVVGKQPIVVEVLDPNYEEMLVEQIGFLVKVEVVYWKFPEKHLT